MPNSSDLEGRFAENRLLRTFSDALRARLLADSELVAMPEGEIVVRTGVNLLRTYFPLGETTVSLNAEIDGGRSIEVASIGSEGAIGGIVSCGHYPAFARAEVIVAGPAIVVARDKVEEAKAGSGHLRNIFCRYSDYLLAQIMQSVGCNSFHSIEQRAARWLLTAIDRAGPRLQLTQEQLARLLGVQRTTLNAVVRSLQDDGAITIRRGSIELRDRAQLLRRSCYCYEAVERHFGDVIGEGGLGAHPSESCGD
ncbi:Crp/Fnr family transcriptional regulator [Sphingomonas sp. ASV193]|uniref:Crp/Fnr family transcriptional regulator n=1 Tax=Sphingomonas sp. ASV193 TaxID=3144405 RepID=UPI0032E85995